MGAIGRRRDGAGGGEHAVVLGASLAGLAAAAVLAKRFRRVTVVEQDTLPLTGRHRIGVPQGRHAHLLLPAGLNGLSELLPGIVDDLKADGAHIVPASEFRFYLGGGRLRLDDDGLRICGATRPAIEAVVRKRVRALPGVRFLEGRKVAGVITTPDRTRVTGVCLWSRTDTNADETVAADLVVDTMGRGSPSPRWLADLGYAVPDEERVRVGVHYSTRLFHRQPGDLDGCRHVVAGIPAGGRRGGLILAVEDDRWLVTLVGFLGERPPTNLEGFVEYAQALATNELHEVAARATPIGEGVTGVFHEYVRRRYDSLPEFPERYVVSGDAVCSLSPIYAQGMTVAIGEAQILGRIVDKHDLNRVGRRFFRQTRKLVDTAWTLATGADLAHPEVEGPRPMSWRLVNAYIDRLLPVAHRDSLVANTFMNVNALMAPPPQLFHPRILARVLQQPRTPARQARPEPVRADQALSDPAPTLHQSEPLPRSRGNHSVTADQPP